MFIVLAPGATSSYISAPGKVLPGPLPTNSFKVTRNVTLGQCAADCSLQYHLNQVTLFLHIILDITKFVYLLHLMHASAAESPAAVVAVALSTSSSPTRMLMMVVVAVVVFVCVCPFLCFYYCFPLFCCF
jgi:hypothetical protein